MGEFRQQLHPELPPTRLWGYADANAPNFRHLGGVMVARTGRPVRVTYINDLPPRHPLPVDQSIMGAGADQLENRAVVHLHGGLTPWPSDGGPHAWFTPDGRHGPSRIAWLPDATGALSYDSYYPNDQSARLVWFHDHALGITRLNAYVGLASAYILRDDFEQDLIDTGAIPGLVAGTEIPIIIQDKVFVPASGNPDPSGRGDYGDLWYPSEYDPLRWDVAPGGAPLPVPSVVPEAFGDTMLVNGLVYPSVEVEPRKYRLRVLNACNARFCNLQLFYARGVDFPRSTEPARNNPGPPFLQIGNEAGFLSEAVGPVLLNQVLLAPAERADLIVDFSAIPPGAILILTNDAAAPFPDGDDDYEFHPELKMPLAGGILGYGPDTRAVLQLRVVPRVGPRDPRPSAPLRLPQIPALSSAGANVRNLTLNEGFDAYGRLVQMLGTDVPTAPGFFGRAYGDPSTENVAAGSTEVWNIFNLSGDTHPIHFHLVNVQVIGRQSFRSSKRDGLRLTGAFRPGDANETGWKETVRMNPGEVTQVIMRFDLPSTPVPVPVSPRTGGHEYVWHCHILEHEEHDMMRPLIVE
jgi:spore coat protein A